MSKILKTIAFSLVSIILLGIVQAFSYFRKDYDVFDFIGMHGFGLFAGFGLFVLIVILFLFIFWLWMLVDCLKRDFKKDIEKIVWAIVLIFLQILGALIYYFVVKIADKKIVKDKKK